MKKRGPKPKPKPVVHNNEPKKRGPKPKPKPAEAPREQKKRGPKPEPKPAIIPREPKKRGPKPKVKQMKRGPKPKSKSTGQAKERLQKPTQSKKKSSGKEPQKLRRANYSRPGLAQENLHKAVTEYKLKCQSSELSKNTKLVAQLSVKYNVPRKVIRSRISKGFDAFLGQGPATGLTKDDELSLTQWCQMRFLNNCPVTMEVLQAEARRISSNNLKANRS